MFKFTWDEFIYDVTCDHCYLIRQDLKEFFFTICSWIRDMFLNAFFTARVLIAKLFCIISRITNLGFIIACIFLILNIYEAIKDNILITKTCYFTPMIYLFGIHVVVYIVTRIVCLGVEDYL